MNKTALIFGAGKTGRGFAAHLAARGGYRLVLVDRNEQLVEALVWDKHYRIEVMGNEMMNYVVEPAAVFYIGDAGWQNDFVYCSLIFTAVFGNNLPELARQLAPAFEQRHAQNPVQPFTIITCENLAGAAALLRSTLLGLLGSEREQWLSETAGFCESIIFCTCLNAAPEQPGTTVRAQNFFELPCDADAISEPLSVYGLKPLHQFGNQLRRKIYTYNCINAVITYMGAMKGYTQLHEAGNDSEILAVAHRAADESSRAQVAEYGFNRREQQAWVQAAFAKFADTAVPDPIDRNGADPARKLGRDDRLLGPALLALKHGIFPAGLLTGILACMQYYDNAYGHTIMDLKAVKGVAFILESICGLKKQESLYKLLSEQLAHDRS